MKKTKITKGEKRRWIGRVIGAVLLASVIILPGKAMAAVNPLAEMPDKVVSYEGVVLGKGCDYFTPFYKGKFSIKAVSSNPKVASVKAYVFKDKSSKKFGGYEVLKKNYGITKIKVTVKLGGKSYKKTCKYTFKRYVSPIKSLKVGKKEYRNQLEKDYSVKDGGNYLKGKVRLKLKSGYKFISATAYTDSFKSTAITNGKKLPGKTTRLVVVTKNKKDGGVIALEISKVI